MLDEYGFDIFEENPFPLAYLLTFRTYGTWLHGDLRYSVGRDKNNRYGGPKIQPSVPFREQMTQLRHSDAIFLDENQRKFVAESISEVCKHRDYTARAINVRSNHAHVVATAPVKPEKIVNDLKAYSTRKLRAEGQFVAEQKIWSRGASTRYLWKPRHVLAAVDYVLYCQEDIPFEFKDHD